MSVENDITVLKRLQLFHSLTDEQLKLVVFGADHLSLELNQKLFDEAERADCAYVVLSGAFNLFRQQNGRNYLVGEAETGSIINELALLTKTERSLTAVAARKTQVLKISREKFLLLLEEFPEITYYLYDYVSQCLHRLAENIAQAQQS